MFRKRVNTIRDFELDRQQMIWDLMVSSPTAKIKTEIQNMNYIQLLTLSIIQHEYIDMKMQALIYRNLDSIVPAFKTKTDMFYNDMHVKRIFKYLKTLTLDNTYPCFLTVKAPIITYIPNVDKYQKNKLQFSFRRSEPTKSTESADNATALIPYDSTTNDTLLMKTNIPSTSPNHILKLEAISKVSLYEFERLCFNNRVLYYYYEGTSFAAYVYQNILYSLNANDLNQLKGNNVWQVKLAEILYKTDFDDFIAFSAFTQNQIVVNESTVIDTSFVPKYRVLELKPVMKRIPKSDNDRIILNYRNYLNPRQIRKVPIQYISIFLTFPFKDKHYIQPNGDIAYINLPMVNQKKIVYDNIELTIQQMCEISDIMQIIVDARNWINPNVLIYKLISENDLKRQGLMLILLRYLIGPYLTLGPFTINLPTMNNILKWSNIANSNECNKILLLKNTIEQNNISTSYDKIKIYVNLIKSIVDNCVSKIGATFLCSSYQIPDVYLASIYELLESDAEKYVFFTLLIQQYPLNQYLKYRDNFLKPVFQNLNTDQNILSSFKKCVRKYINVTTKDRLHSYTIPLILSNEISDYTECPPYTCLELYEFKNPQLKNLVELGDTELTNLQMASFITLCIQKYLKSSSRNV